MVFRWLLLEFSRLSNVCLTFAFNIFEAFFTTPVVLPRLMWNVDCTFKSCDWKMDVASVFLDSRFGLRVFHTPRYRMHGSICHFPSKHFYGNRLENVENLKLLPASASVWPQPDQRVVWIDCDSPHQQGRVIQVGNSRCLLLHCFFFGRGGWEWGYSRWWFGEFQTFLRRHLKMWRLKWLRHFWRIYLAPLGMFWNSCMGEGSTDLKAPGWTVYQQINRIS